MISNRFLLEWNVVVVVVVGRPLVALLAGGIIVVMIVETSVREMSPWGNF